MLLGTVKVTRDQATKRSSDQAISGQALPGSCRAREKFAMSNQI
jgi:hypothetical protein